VVQGNESVGGNLSVLGDLSVIGTVNFPLTPINLLVNPLLIPNGKTIFSTVQSAINSLKNKLPGGTTTITIKEGIYNEDINLNQLLFNDDRDLIFFGDSRNIVGLGFVQNLNFNPLNILSLGGGVTSNAQISIIQNVGQSTITITNIGVGGNPNFGSVVSGDTLVFRNILLPTITYDKYVVVSSLNNTITVQGNIPTTISDGSGFFIRPNVVVRSCISTTFSSFYGIAFEPLVNQVGFILDGPQQVYFKNCSVQSGTIGISIEKSGSIVNRNSINQTSSVFTLFGQTSIGLNVAFGCDVEIDSFTILADTSRPLLQPVGCINIESDSQCLINNANLSSGSIHPCLNARGNSSIISTTTVNCVQLQGSNVAAPLLLGAINANTSFWTSINLSNLNITGSPTVGINLFGGPNMVVNNLRFNSKNTSSIIAISTNLGSGFGLSSLVEMNLINGIGFRCTNQSRMIVNNVLSSAVNIAGSSILYRLSNNSRANICQCPNNTISPNSIFLQTDLGPVSDIVIGSIGFVPPPPNITGWGTFINLLSKASVSALFSGSVSVTRFCNITANSNVYSSGFSVNTPVASVLNKVSSLIFDNITQVVFPPPIVDITSTFTVV